MLFINNRLFRDRYNGHIIPGNICRNHEQITTSLNSNLNPSERRLFLTERLKKSLPVKYFIFHSSLLFISSVSLIILQIFGIINKSTSFSIGSGIWIGVYFLITCFTSLSLVKFRVYNLLVMCFMLHFCGIFLSIFSSVFFNTLGAVYANKENSIDGINLAMLSIGLFCTLLSILFVIVIECKISTWKKTREIAPTLETSTNRLNSPNLLNQISFNFNSSTNDTVNETIQIFYVQPSPPEYDPPPSYEVAQKNALVTNRSLNNNNNQEILINDY